MNILKAESPVALLAIEMDMGVLVVVMVMTQA